MHANKFFAFLSMGVTSMHATDVTLSVRYEKKSGFCVSHTVPSTDPIDVYIIPYNGFQITGIERYTGAKKDPLTLVNSVPFTGGRYVATEPIGQDMTIVVVATQSGGPTTAISDVRTDSCDQFFSLLVNGKTITIEGVEDPTPIVVTNLAGQTVYQGNGTTVTVANPGLYFVTVGQSTAKVLVK